jgi:pyrroloquinoline quinone biosynthesis protein B
VRRGRIRSRMRTQSSIAVSGDGTSWVLVNASPDILAQLRGFPDLQPARALRDTALAAVVLVDSQIDHTTGLLMLREGAPLRVHCTDAVWEDLVTGNPLFNVLRHYCGVERQRMDTGEDASFRITGIDALVFRAIPLSSKAPPYSPHRDAPRIGDNVGISVTDQATGGELFYAPGLGRIEPHLGPVLQRAHCLLVDGTFWSDDEMIRLGVSEKRAQDLGHLPQSGRGGMIEALAPYASARRVLIHINNTNPILNEDSAERAQLTAAGIEVAHDGMEIAL